MKVATLKTNKGEIRIELFEDKTPKTVANFEKLIGEGYYEGLSFHRVIDDFIVQGGCPRGDGTGGFSAVERYGVGQPAQDLEVADFDGDGVVDAAVLTEADTGTASYPAVILLRGLGEGPALDLALGELVPGREATLTVTGAEAQETVQVAGSAAGIGPGPCPPALGGLCLDLLEPRLVGSAEADGAGTAVVTFVVPAGAPVGATLHFQAVAVRGPGGVDSVKSAPASGPVVAP